ncbi:hypothetical protein DPMN_136858 [Dreissena polymorpha]|uniref:Uncharacterized protein n=1 Tax=Dreissena polymorpha TaxID=45954 RepID=A0A9D4G6P9_DREPO|nr:hypothetical protein DPMN_136858 [Dreissena polymorpha]
MTPIDFEVTRSKVKVTVTRNSPDPSESESIESDDGRDAMDTKITESDEGRFYPIMSETSEAVTCNSETETLLGN